MKNRFSVLFFTVALFVLLGNLSAQPYFQQEVNYTINVKLDDVKNELIADESIEYINNSPNPLSFIYMHLWPNAYKDNTTPLAKQFLENGETEYYFAKEEEYGYIDQIDFKINGQSAKWELLKDSIDICKLFLNEPLKSGNKITITTPFHVKIPSGKFSRLGHIDQSYQISQWYPKPAVYDRNGWNYMPYLHQGEFYSEFGSFDVSITLPKNYVLGATGDIVDGEKEMEWLSQKVKETEAITSFDAKDMAFPASDTEIKTLRFKQNNVHDFAWFCDKRFHVLKGEIITPHSKNKVTTWTMFTNAEGNLWKKSIEYINDAIYYYSLWNGDYPYTNCTAVDGTISAGAGMEYPNITVIGSSGNANGLETTIMHEVGHNWFYGMLGSNERKHPWMDEGINSFNELRYIETKYPELKLVGEGADKKMGKAFDLSRYMQKNQYQLMYLLSATKNEDQPIELPAYNYTEFNYGGIVYSKTAIVFDYLRTTIGEKAMDKAMQRYFEEWKFKHPQPSDLRKIMEESTGKNLSWFFDDLINSTKKLDYKITFANKNPTGAWDIGVKNTGEIKGSVFIQGIKNNKVVAEVMYDGFEGKKALNFPAADIDYFKIDFMEDMPEINRNNNTIRTKGIFKKTEPLKLQFLGSLDNPDKTQLFWAPVAGWNNYNQWMFGVAFYNSLIPQKKFDFQLMPMYSYTTKDIVGYGKMAYTIFPKGVIFQNVSIGITGTRYAYSDKPFDMNFNKIAPELNIEFKKSDPRKPAKHVLRYRNISIIKDYYKSNYTSTPPVYSRSSLYKNFNDLSLIVTNANAINPFSMNTNFQAGEKIKKLSTTINYFYRFKAKGRGIGIRLFAGTFIDTKNVNLEYRFRLSGQRSVNGAGGGDYLYDNIYLGRSETKGILANQFTETDGGFKFYSPLGRTSKWITAMNFKSSLGNVPLPLYIFADIGTTDNDGLINQKLLYDAGICISFPKNIFEIYFPVFISQDFKNYKDANGLKYPETIRFVVNLNLINPFDLIRNFSL